MMTYHYPYPHACGLDIDDADQAAALVEPRVITFTPSGGREPYGDIDIDGVDFGWYPESAAHSAADFFGNADLRIAARTVEYVPRNPRRV